MSVTLWGGELTNFYNCLNATLFDVAVTTVNLQKELANFYNCFRYHVIDVTVTTVNLQEELTNFYNCFRYHVIDVTVTTVNLQEKLTNFYNCFICHVIRCGSYNGYLGMAYPQLNNGFTAPRCKVFFLPQPKIEHPA